MIIVIVFVWIGIALLKPISLDGSVVVKKGDTLNVFMSRLTGSGKIKLKVYIKTHPIDLDKLQLGTYQFSGSYSPAEFLDVIKDGPTSEYIRFTVLEGWSIYDIDAALAEK